MDETNSLIEQRKAKLAALRAKGIDPFRNKFTPSESCQQARANYTEGREVVLAGRITAHRDMGKSISIDIRDQSGRMAVNNRSWTRISWSRSNMACLPPAASASASIACA